MADNLTYYKLANQLTIYKIAGATTVEVDTASDIYAYDSFDAYDKYGAFMQGNAGYSSLAGDGESKILVLYNIDSFKSDAFFNRASVRG